MGYLYVHLSRWVSWSSTRIWHYQKNDELLLMNHCWTSSLSLSHLGLWVDHLNPHFHDLLKAIVSLKISQPFTILSQPPLAHCWWLYRHTIASCLHPLPSFHTRSHLLSIIVTATTYALFLLWLSISLVIVYDRCSSVTACDNFVIMSQATSGSSLTANYVKEPWVPQLRGPISYYIRKLMMFPKCKPMITDIILS